MLATTLIPTAAHAFVALFSVLPCSGTRSWRIKLGQLIESRVEANYVLPTLYFTFWWVIALGIVVSGFWFALWLLTSSGISVSKMLMYLALWTINGVDAIFGG